MILHVCLYLASCPRLSSAYREASKERTCHSQAEVGKNPENPPEWQVAPVRRWRGERRRNETMKDERRETGKDSERTDGSKAGEWSEAVIPRSTSAVENKNKHVHYFAPSRGIWF